MSEFVQLRSPYKISDLNLDRIATKEHQRKNKLIVKIYYKPNRGHHTDFLFQTPEVLLKNSIKYNLQIKLTFFCGFIMLILSETTLRYSTISFISTLIYLIAPWICFLVAYLTFIIKSKNV